MSPTISQCAPSGSEASCHSGVCCMNASSGALSWPSAAQDAGPGGAAAAAPVRTIAARVRTAIAADARFISPPFLNDLSMTKQPASGASGFRYLVALFRTQASRRDGRRATGFLRRFVKDCGAARREARSPFCATAVFPWCATDPAPEVVRKLALRGEADFLGDACHGQPRGGQQIGRPLDAGLDQVAVWRRTG